MKLHIPVIYICNGLLDWLSHFNISITLFVVLTVIEILINHIAFTFPCHILAEYSAQQYLPKICVSGNMT